MNVYVFGNEDLNIDNRAIKTANKLKTKIKDINFIRIDVNQDLPISESKNLIILDTVMGLDEVTEIKENDLDKLILTKSLTAHDYDLGFQLKYLRKLRKISSFTILGIPMSGKLDYLRITSILRKLVAQDMHGS